MAANEPPVREPVEDYEAPSQAEIDALFDEAVAEALADEGAWVCSYDVTMNYDWHDDVLCTNGDDYDRPYLRSWDDYVTESELMASAAEYEAELNGN